MNATSRLAFTVIAGSALAGCHQRQPETVYTAPTETVTTTTTMRGGDTTSSTTSTTYGSTSSSKSSSADHRDRNHEMGDKAHMERREVHMAMASIERARRELERAGHDFGGRKGDAMKASNAALHELRLASGQEAREERTGVETASERRAEGHELHLALADLERARDDMEHAKHDYSGRRREVLESVDNAIREIRLAAEHER